LKLHSGFVSNIKGTMINRMNLTLINLKSP
jgi:hypothetical protein